MRRPQNQSSLAAMKIALNPVIVRQSFEPDSQALQLAMGTITSEKLQSPATVSCGRFTPIRMTEKTFPVDVKVTLLGCAQKQRGSTIHHVLAPYVTG
jgi:hypothetical protein